MNPFPSNFHLHKREKDIGRCLFVSLEIVCINIYEQQSQEMDFPPSGKLCISLVHPSGIVKTLVTLVFALLEHSSLSKFKFSEHFSLFICEYPASSKHCNNKNSICS